MSEGVLHMWQVTEPEPKRGHPHTYSNTAIVTMATLQEIWRSPAPSHLTLCISIEKRYLDAYGGVLSL
jgi:hypothetical protein